MQDNISELLEGGTVVDGSDSSLVVEVDGVEVFVYTRVEHSGCNCCGNAATFDASYNRSTEYRVENHGSADPLGIEE